MSRKRSLRDLELSPGTRVLVRTDFNVPFHHGTQQITDDSRIAASLPTIQFLVERRCKIIACSHRGRPRGRRDETLSLAPVARRLEELAGAPVKLASDCVGADAESAIAETPVGGIALLENLRFRPGEEACDPEFCERLAELADFYVNDGFSAAHRDHASTAGVARRLPSAAGMLMEREIEALDRVTKSPERPFVVVIGGAKVADKLRVIGRLAPIADSIVIGGGMSGAFLSAAGRSVRTESDGERDVALARDILTESTKSGLEVILPVDVAVCESISASAPRVNVEVDSISSGLLVADIGPRTIDVVRGRVSGARTVVWNGPMGVFEFPQFAAGTAGVADVIAEASSAYTVVGGGSTAEAVRSMGLSGAFSHVSTGGGATLEYLEGRDLPGIEALPNA